MDRKLISQTNFKEICKILKDEKYELHDCMNGIFHVALLFFPVLMCKETAFITNLANGATLLNAKTEIEKAAKNLFHTFDRKSYEDFTTKYEHAQIAQVLIVFSAYFDSMKMYLPDEEKAIQISEKEKIFLTEESIAKYIDLLTHKSQEQEETHAKYIFEYDLSIPDPVESLEQYLQHLRQFYDILNEEFLDFYQNLSFWEKLNGQQRERFMAILRGLPAKAVQNYKKQYYQLAVTFHDFFVWTNMQQHENITRKIDIGFARLTEQLVTYQEKQSNAAALSTLEKYRIKYQDWIDGAVIDTQEMEYDSSENVVFPAKKDIFVPQRFKSLLYRNNLRLESSKTWANCEERQNIGKFISDVLRHSVTGSLPLLILGHPGAGKSLLCHMLAARILFHEYHVIIVRLRDTIADLKIRQQIDQQIERDFTNGCTWDMITESGPQKPLLIIFDGYDELLQASGKTYSNYLQEIADFQREEKIYRGILVKCIITSRITLIDKALIANNTPVIMLSDFNESEIDMWSRIWNEHNAAYFATNNLEPLVIEETGKISELAKQPLLLLMLALFDSNDNALKKNKDLNSTQLYDKLIREFISREKRKNKSFKNKPHTEQQDILALEVKKISIAALGMYNRKALYIRGEDLENDLHFILPKEMFHPEFHGGELSESDKLLGSFFFIHRSDATDMVNKEKRHSSAYEFLHNTFGEFLTANYIIDETYNILNWIQLLLQGHQEHQWNPENQKTWFICLTYAPLFSRPVVVEMIHEWSYSYFEDEGMRRELLDKAFDFLMDSEIQRILRGDAIFTLKKILDENGNPYQQEEMLKHLAVYSLNLIILKTITWQNEYRFPFGQDAWNKLLSLWKYAFSEDELLNYSELFKAEVDSKDRTCYRIRYIANRGIQPLYQSRIAKLAAISSALGDEIMSGITASLMGEIHSGQIIDLLNRNELNIRARFYWNYLLNYFSNNLILQTELLCTISYFYESCMMDKDVRYLLSFYMILHFLLKSKIIKVDEETNNFLLKYMINGIEHCQSVHGNDVAFRLDYNETLFPYISMLAIDLLDYSKPNEKSLKKIFNAILYRNKEYDDRYIFYNVNNVIEISSLYLRAIQKITAHPENRSTAKKIIKYFHADDYFIQIIDPMRNHKVYSVEIICNCFEVVYHLLLLEAYHQSTIIFNHCMKVLQANDYKHAEQITTFRKIPIIDALYLMHKRNLSPLSYTRRALKNIIRDVDVPEIFDASPETVGHLLSLLGLHTFINPLKMRDNLSEIIKNKRDDIPIGVYKQIYGFAQKRNFRDLLALLDEMMKE